MKRILSFFVLSLLLTASLTACRGEALPRGMEEEALLAAGREVMLDVVSGEYEAVYAALREDVRESTTVEDIRALALSATDGAGVYKQIESSMTTGQTVGGTQIGIAVFFCEFSEDDVLVRVSFDSQMTLVGLSLQQQ